MASNALTKLCLYADSDSDPDSCPDDDPSSRLDAKHRIPQIKDTAKSELSEVVIHPQDHPESNLGKRKLPQLSHELFETSSSTNAPPTPSKRPKRGEWLCYCFVDLPLNDRLESLVDECHNDLQRRLPPTNSFHDLLLDTMETKSNNVEPRRSSSDPTRSKWAKEEGKGHLHISLTRPITVRPHEREDFVQEAKTLLARHFRDRTGRFPIAFSRISHLQNDEHERDFLVLEVGLGWEKLQEVSAILSKGLYRAFRARQYYQEARFHASTGFLELKDGGNQPKGQATCSSPLDLLVAQLEAQYGPRLRACPATIVHRIGIQVGKQVTYVHL